MVEPLVIHRERQHHTFERYRRTELTAERADHAIMEMYRKGVIGVQRIPEVLKEWKEPSHEEWGGGPPGACSMRQRLPSPGG